MSNKNYLNEEFYQNSKNKLRKISLIVLILGIIIGLPLLFIGFSKGDGVDESALKRQQEQEFMENGFSDEYYELEEQLDNYNSRYKFFVSGGVIIFFLSFVSFAIYMFSNQREITAFATQQSLPIEKEKIEEMSPTMGSAAKEIAKGIKEGLKDEEK